MYASVAFYSLWLPMYTNCLLKAVQTGDCRIFAPRRNPEGSLRSLNGTLFTNSFKPQATSCRKPFSTDAYILQSPVQGFVYSLNSNEIYCFSSQALFKKHEGWRSLSLLIALHFHIVWASQIATTTGAALAIIKWSGHYSHPIWLHKQSFNRNKTDYA